MSTAAASSGAASEVAGADDDDTEVAGGSDVIPECRERKRVERREREIFQQVSLKGQDRTATRLCDWTIITNQLAKFSRQRPSVLVRRKPTYALPRVGEETWVAPLRTQDSTG